MTGGRYGHVGYCEIHGKLIYNTRKAARRLVRISGERGMRPYRCTVLDHAFHVGHLPWAVRRGELTVRDVWPGAA